MTARRYVETCRSEQNTGYFLQFCYSEQIINPILFCITEMLCVNFNFVLPCIIV
jgi:hypothetical protein